MFLDQTERLFDTAFLVRANGEAGKSGVDVLLVGS
jgi:hypothetical protein